MVYKHSLCIGTVWHKRYYPKVHEFNYKLNSWLINLQELDKLNTNSRVVNFAKKALYRFKPQNYLRDFAGDLNTKIRNQFTNLGVNLKGCEDFYLLGQLSNLGIYFSPLNLYFCYNGEACNYIMAEVSNTPWNERHYYLLDTTHPEIITDKNFHVSPFFGLNQKYKWQFDFSSEQVKFTIDTYQDGVKVFSAGYSACLNLLSFPQINSKILAAPVTGCKILLGIYFEALLIWLKKIPYVPYRKH
jgi:DUF1365 family protein